MIGLEKLDAALKLGTEILAQEAEAQCGDWQSEPGMSEESKKKLMQRIEELEKSKR